MSENTKVIFTVGISINGCYEEHEFTLDELGYDPKLDTDLEKYLDEQWIEWKNDRVDGGWALRG